MRRSCDISVQAFSEELRQKCFRCEESEHSVVQCFTINFMCEKDLVHQDANSRLCWEHAGDEDVGIHLFQDQL